MRRFIQRMGSCSTCCNNQKSSSETDFHDDIVQNNVQEIKEKLSDGLNANAPFVVNHKLVDVGPDGLSSKQIETRFLHLAIIYRRPGVVRALLEAGACPTTTDSMGRCPLQLVITYWPRVHYEENLDDYAMPDIDMEDWEFVKYLDGQHKSSQTTFSLLLEAGAKVDVVCGEVGDSLLHLAARFNIRNCVSSLVEHGTPLDAVNKEGDTALILACRKGTPDVADKLLTCGASVNMRDALGRTALHNACLNRIGDSILVRQLVHHGADVDDRDNEGNTALHLAMGAKSTNVVTLVCHDATVDMVNHNGETPLFLHLDRPPDDQAFINPHTIELLVELSLYVRLVDNNNRTPASFTDQHPELRALLDLQTNAPVSLFQLARHRVRRCLGVMNYHSVNDIALDCPLDLKSVIVLPFPLYRFPDLHL